jgi:Flp pilus assembly pilin Flp
MLRRDAGENRQRDIRNAYERRRRFTAAATAAQHQGGRFGAVSYMVLTPLWFLSYRSRPNLCHETRPTTAMPTASRGGDRGVLEQRAQGGTGEMAILEMLRAYLNEVQSREDGVVGMEYAVVAAVVIVAVATALTAGQPAISGIVNTALTAVQNAIT